MYKPTIGLEIHAELSTKTKMFCDCLNDPDEEKPNTNVCPVCLAHPGVLPTINYEAVKSVRKLGLAIGADILEFSKFDRKNYFYPDLPKGYQISQYDEPLVKGGSLAGIKITRVHLEEDTGRLLHDESGSSLVDFNRAGRPLMELVTEPVIHSADDALKFAKELQLILRYLDISRADMEHGEMRVEANISIAPEAPQIKADGMRMDADKIRANQRENPRKSVLGTKVEVKNLNSFRAVRDAIAYELKRQEDVLESGGKLVQETRGWDDAKRETYSQRTKEDAHDYRYFPEPDLPPLFITKKEVKTLKAELPELPEDKRKRFMKEFGLRREQVDILVDDKELSIFYEETISEFDKELGEKADRNLAYNYLTSDLMGLVKTSSGSFSKIPVNPENFADLLVLIIKGELSSRSAKDILIKMFQTGGDPNEIMKLENLGQISGEEELRKIVLEIISSSAVVVADYKKGKMNALEALIGRAMGKLKGRGNPELLRKLFLEELAK